MRTVHEKTNFAVMRIQIQHRARVVKAVIDATKMQLLQSMHACTNFTGYVRACL